MRYLQRFLLAAPASLRALVQEASCCGTPATAGWHNAIRNDIYNLRQCMPDAMGHLPNPHLQFGPWQSFILDTGSRWKDILTRYIKLADLQQHPQLHKEPCPQRIQPIEPACIHQCPLRD